MENTIITNIDLLEGVPLYDLDYSINISLNHNYIYVETPKVACTTLKTILQDLEKKQPNFKRNNTMEVHNRDLSPLTKPSKINDFEELLNSSIFKFCFSRNPYSRLLSAYLDKICRNKPHKREVLIHLGKDPEDLDQEISFEQFVNVVCEQPVSSMNPHWRIQYYQTFQKLIDFDFIGKIELFPNDLHFALQHVDKTYQRYLSAETKPPINSGQYILKYYTHDLEEKVYSKFIKDFKFFGYSNKIEDAS